MRQMMHDVRVIMMSVRGMLIGYARLDMQIVGLVTHRSWVPPALDD
jgi:hypothetical protein